MHELLDGAAGERMELPAYYADFEKQFWNIDGLGFWKLERQQFFQEPGYNSWEAFARGDWETSLRLLEAGRADMDAYHRKIDEHGFVARRVRVVEEPITAYLQWELYALRVRDECGGKVRVVGPVQVTPLEATGPLPEIYTLGSAVLYEAVYDQRGILEAARRYTDRELILRCQRLIADLYAVGEPLEDYFSRHVADLPPPGPQELL
jgi:hypothetical protein